MKTIFYTTIETAPEHATVHADGAASRTLADIIRHAHVRGYELVPFEGWSDVHADTGMIQDNVRYINDLLETLEIQCAENNRENRYYPIIADMRHRRAMEDEEGLAIVQQFTK